VTVRVPAAMFPHAVYVESYRGAGAYGPRYLMAERLKCLHVDEVKLIRDAQSGDQVTSSAQLYCPPGTVVPPQSRVTLPDGSIRTAMRTATFDAGGLPLPGSVVVYLA
jgi:hypothetical protein